MQFANPIKSSPTHPDRLFSVGQGASEVVLAELLVLPSLMLNLHYRADKGPLGQEELRGLIERIEWDEDAAGAEAPAGGAAAQQRADPKDPTGGEVSMAEWGRKEFSKAWPSRTSASSSDA